MSTDEEEQSVNDQARSNVQDLRVARNNLVSAHRVPCAARFQDRARGGEEYGKSDPAPPWVPALVDEVFAHVEGSPWIRAMIAAACLDWCMQGEPVTRAEQLISLILAWVGPRNAMLATFLEDAITLGAGAAKGRKVRGVRVVAIPEAWPKSGPARPIVQSIPRALFVEPNPRALFVDPKPR